MDRELQHELTGLLQHDVLVTLSACLDVGLEVALPVLAVVERPLQPHQPGKLQLLRLEYLPSVVIDLLNLAEEVNQKLVEVLDLFEEEHLMKTGGLTILDNAILAIYLVDLGSVLLERH